MTYLQVPQEYQVKLTYLRLFPEVTGLKAGKMFHPSPNNLVIEDTIDVPPRRSLRVVDGTPCEINIVFRISVPVSS